MSRGLAVTIALVAGVVAWGSAGWAQSALPAQPAPPAPPAAGTPASGGAGDSERDGGGAGEAARDVGRAGPPRVLPAEDVAPGAEAGAGADLAPAAASASADASAPLDRAAAPERQPAEARLVRFSPFGYLRAQWTGVLDDPDVAAVGRSDGFSLQHARLGVRGAVGERVAYEVSFDGAVDERDRVNLPNGRLRVGLRDAYVEVRPSPRWPGALRVGRFEPWFDPEGYEADTTRAFIDRALESHGVSAGEGWETEGLPPGRSMGAAWRMQVLPWRVPAVEAAARPALFVEVAASNGAAEFASVNDNNSLAFSAAVRLILPGRGWVQAAARHNARTEGELPFRQDETDLGASLGAGLRVGPLALGGGGVFVRTTFPTTGGSSQRAWGAHGQAMWRLLDGAQPMELGYRFAILDPSSLVVTDRLMEHTVGVSVAEPAWRMRLLINATHAVEQAGRALRNSRGEIVLELVL